MMRATTPEEFWGFFDPSTKLRTSLTDWGNLGYLLTAESAESAEIDFRLLFEKIVVLY
jgi:hypothetical protein